MLFKDIIGQDEVKLRLLKLAKDNRIPHAQLVTGPEGSGKLPLILAFVRYLFCKNPNENDACGVCPSCRKISKLEHPDLHFSFPVVKKGSAATVSDDYLTDWKEMVLQSPYISFEKWLNFLKAENKQPIIYSEESSSILKKLSFKTYEAPFKVMVIYQPEKMHVSCANKLLKLIEDPPEDTLFFLITDQPELIISTIQSRCQILHIPKIKKEKIIERLISDHSISNELATEICRISNGNYLEALNALESTEERLENIKSYRLMLRYAWQKDVVGLKKWAEGMASLGREKQKSFLNFMLHFTRESFILKFREHNLNYISTDEMDLVERLSPFVHEKNVIPYAHEMELAIRHIESNVNAKMVFFDLSLKYIVLLKS